MTWTLVGQTKIRPRRAGFLGRNLFGEEERQEQDCTGRAGGKTHRA